MRNFLKSAALIGLALGALIAEAKADVIFPFTEVSASIGGVPTDAGATGEIVLTDAGFAAGHGSAFGTLLPSFPIAFDGVSFVSFQAFFAPPIDTAHDGISSVGLDAVVNGSHLDVSGTLGGGFGLFLTGFSETETYQITGSSSLGLVTIQYASDGPNPCDSHGGIGDCFVTGFFGSLNAIPEPGSLSVLTMAVSAFAVLGIARRRRIRN